MNPTDQEHVELTGKTPESAELNRDLTDESLKMTENPKDLEAESLKVAENCEESGENSHSDGEAQTSAEKASESDEKSEGSVGESSDLENKNPESSADSPESPKNSEESPKNSEESSGKSSQEQPKAPVPIKDPSAEKKLRKEAKKTLADAKKLFKRAQKHLTPERERLALDAISGLEKALSESEYSCAPALDQLKTVVNKHLNFARKSGAQELFESLLFAVVFALVLRTFLVEPFKIPTRSMVPTLLEGDQLFVTKLSYGLRLPIYNDYVVRWSDPRRGDVIVFAFPNAEAAAHLARTNSNCMQLETIAEEKDYIKRIIGVEGDTVEIIDQVVHVNGEPVSQVPIYSRLTSFYFSESTREYWNHEHLDDADFTTITHEIQARRQGPFKVKPGHVFVMGDNRDNSADSRCWGQVPIANIKGRAQIIWWSNGHFAPRWERMFTVIH